ncbi:TetR/AcrR family transcriptional regulator [Undibacterium arcticum]
MKEPWADLPKTLLSRATIAQAALDIIDEAGAPALTMRALADRFGVRGASLYNHISSKDDLIDAVSELINREIDLSPLLSPDWQRGVADYARDYRAVYRRHPNIIAIVARGPVASTDALAGYDALLAALRRAGCSVAEAAATRRGARLPGPGFCLGDLHHRLRSLSGPLPSELPGSRRCPRGERIFGRPGIEYA